MIIRVLVVDDHPLVVDGLATGLRQTADLAVVASAGSLREARGVLEVAGIDVVLLDLRLPDGSGTTLLAESQTQVDPPAFIVLSSFETPQYIDAALRLGAQGFILKTASIDDIAGAIRKVAAGGNAFSAEQLLRVRESGWAPLSQRDRDIVERLVAGRSNDEIGADLGVSTKTVEAHLSRLFERYAVMSRTELAVLAERDQWLEVPSSGRTRG